MPYLLDVAYFWMILGTYEDEPIVFDNWQIADLRDYSRIRVREKAPQIGFSWTRACEAVWEALMFEDSTSGFISVDQREATEKVLYARKLYMGLPPLIQSWVPLVRESTEELHFGDPARPSRVASYPATAGMRGRRMTVTLDEVDFYKDGGREAFRAAITRVMRSPGLRVTMGSTCFGQDTELDRLMTMRNLEGEEESDVVQSVARYPWPVAEKDEVVGGIEMARRVLDAADFGEEYECIRGGSALDPFPADLIRRQTHDWGAFPVEQETGRLMIDSPAPMVAGYDVGQTRNPSILSVLEKQPSGIWRQRALLMPTRDQRSGLSLPQQLDWLIELLVRVPQLVIVPDAKGIGAHIGEALLSKFGEKRVIMMNAGAKPEDHESQDKDLMIVEIKRMLEAGELELQTDREQATQFRRTRKDPKTKRFVQKGAHDETHFDRFWATTYGVYGIRDLKGLVSPYSDPGRHLTVVGGSSRGRRFG